MKRPTDVRRAGATDLVTAELVDRCKRGDERAWAELVEATHREVYTLCLRILNDPHDAAEATQETYLKAWRGLKGFRGDAMFSTWLYRVATNAAISKHRGRKRRRTHESVLEHEALSQVVSSAPSTEDDAGARIEVQELERQLRTLPEHYRTAVVLRDVYGLGIEELAKRLKITQTAAKVRVHRGRKMLKELMFPGDAKHDGKQGEGDEV